MFGNCLSNVLVNVFFKGVVKFKVCKGRLFVSVFWIFWIIVGWLWFKVNVFVLVK